MAKRSKKVDVRTVSGFLGLVDPQLYWPWFVTAGGYLALLPKWWFISAVAGAFAVVVFALFTPVPCRV